MQQIDGQRVHTLGLPWWLFDTDRKAIWAAPSTNATVPNWAYRPGWTIGMTATCCAP